VSGWYRPKAALAALQPKSVFQRLEPIAVIKRTSGSRQEPTFEAVIGANRSGGYPPAN
jgi:hypothetical protein